MPKIHVKAIEIYHWYIHESEREIKEVDAQKYSINEPQKMFHSMMPANFLKGVIKHTIYYCMTTYFIKML